MTKEQILALAGEPVAWWVPNAEQFAIMDKPKTRPFAKAFEPLFAADQILATRKPLEDEIAELKQHHRACLVDAYKQLGISGEDGEFRYKWVALEIANLITQSAELKQQLESYRADAERWKFVELLMYLGYVEMKHDEDGGYSIDVEPAENIVSQHWTGNSPEEVIDAARKEGE